MNPIITYEQRFAGVFRRFDLHQDHLAVHGRKFGSSFDVRYNLSSLDAQFDRALVRAPLFYGGLALVGIALLGVIILALAGDLMRPALIVLGVIALVGFAALIFRLRPLRVFMFKNKTSDYAFEIIGAGPDACRADEFVSCIAGQVRRANGEV